MVEEIKLNDFNNLQDNPNIFIKLIESLINTYNLEINKINEISSYNRDFYVFLNGYDGYIEIDYNYGLNTLKYSIGFSIELCEKVEKYILQVITKTAFKKDEVVTDIFGNKYSVIDNFSPNTPINGMLKMKSIDVFDIKNNKKAKIGSNMIVKL